jgi:hypothetical protein
MGLAQKPTESLPSRRLVSSDRAFSTIDDRIYLVHHAEVPRLSRHAVGIWVPVPKRNFSDKRLT